METRLLLALAVALVFASPAAADDTVLTTVPEDTPLSAYGGHVVWSIPMTGGYGLVHWHDGRLEPLAVAPRPVPFDIDVGPDARGRAVALYSRCRDEPPADDIDSWTIARGCDVYAYTLEGAGRERLVRSISRRASSETTPSMWRGAIAFARRATGWRGCTCAAVARGAPRGCRAGRCRVASASWAAAGCERAPSRSTSVRAWASCCGS